MRPLLPERRVKKGAAREATEAIVQKRDEPPAAASGSHAQVGKVPQNLGASTTSKASTNSGSVTSSSSNGTTCTPPCPSTENVPQQPGVSMSALAARAAELASRMQQSPGLQRLLQQPHLLRGAIAQDPRLESMLADNPTMAALLEPDKLKQVLELTSHPEQLLAGRAPGLLPEGADLTQQRMALQGLQQFTQQQHQLHAMDATRPHRMHPPGMGPGRPTSPNDAAALASSTSGAATGAGAGTGEAASGGGGDSGGVDGVGGTRPLTLPAATWHHNTTRLQGSLARLHAMQALSTQGNGLPSGLSLKGAGASLPGPLPLGLSADHAQFYSPALAYAQQQQQAATGSFSPATSGVGAGVRAAMRPPMQHAPLFAGQAAPRAGAGEGLAGSSQGTGEGGLQEGYSFTHSEQEVGLHTLPVEVQQQLLQQQQQQGRERERAQQQQPHTHPHSLTSDQELSHSWSQLQPGSEAAKQRYAELYSAFCKAQQVQGGGSGGSGGGPPLLPAPDPGPMWAAYYLAYPEVAAAAAGGGAGGGVGVGAAAAGGGELGMGRSASHYYEQVTPSAWKPEGGDGCLELYRRAYCSHADALWPPLWALLSCLAVRYLPSLPLLLLGPGLLLLLVLGVWLFTSVLAGYAPAQLHLSRTTCSFILSLEVVIAATCLLWLLPAWPNRWSLPGLGLGAAVTLLPMLHAACTLTPPGYVEAGSQQGEGATSTSPGPAGWASSSSSSSMAKAEGGQAGNGHAGGEEGEGVTEHTALLQGGVAAAGRGLGGLQGGPGNRLGASGGAAAGEGGEAAATRDGLCQGGPGGLEMCTTCHVPRPLRSKHCQVCKQCVHRFDHHCPATFNCVGERNQRLFLAFIVTMAITQVLFLSVGFSFLSHQYSLLLPQPTSPDTGPTSPPHLLHTPPDDLLPGSLLTTHSSQNSSSWSTPRGAQDIPELAVGVAGVVGAIDSVEAHGFRRVIAVLEWAARGDTHRGLLLLLLLQAPLALAGLFLACRTLFNAAANLTTNELINRGKYLYLNHEAVGYTNRFDRGVLHNCFQFWCHPHQDWWRLYGEGDRAMVRSSRTVLSIWSPGLLLRAIDLVRLKRAAVKRQLEANRLARALARQAAAAELN